MIRPNPLLVHVRQRGADQQERRLHHQRQQQPELVRREIVDRVDALYPGVVDQDVGVEFQALQRRDVEKIYRPGLSADLFGQRLGRRLVDVGDGDAGAAAGQFARTGRTDTTGAAGDDGGTAIQIPHANAFRSVFATSSASATSSAFRSMPLVSRVNTTAMSVTMQAAARYSATGTDES